MDIEKTVNDILLSESENASVLEISKVGSQLFQDRVGDYDYFVILDGFSKYKKFYKRFENDIKYDFIFTDKKAFYDQLDFNKSDLVDPRHKIYNYFHTIKVVLSGSHDFSWDMFSHQEEYMNFLRNRYLNTIAKVPNKRVFSKLFVHFYLVLKMFDNGSSEITQEMSNAIRCLYNSTVEAGLIIDWTIDKLVNYKGGTT